MNEQEFDPKGYAVREAYEKWWNKQHPLGVVLSRSPLFPNLVVVRFDDGTESSHWACKGCRALEVGERVRRLDAEVYPIQNRWVDFSSRRRKGQHRRFPSC